ncbi:MAG: DnaJ domain-containing protein [bacterium]|nr:DnaJ domain-containing protein [bacterium]
MKPSDTPPPGSTPEANPEAEKNIREIDQLFTKIENGKLNYYELLGVPNNVRPENVKKSYFDLSRKYHPDRINLALDSTTMQKATAVVAAINIAFETLSNRPKRDEYDVSLRKRSSGTDKEHELKDAKTLYLRANALYKKKQYSEALTYMDKAIRIDSSKSSYYLLLGLCQAKIPITLKMAEESLQKASDMEPWNADPIYALGELYRSQGLRKKADRCFQEALDRNLDHTLAGKAMDEIKGVGSKKKPLFSFFRKKE